MSVIEKSGLIKYKDADGNLYLLYPITTKDNVDGMEEIDAHLVDTNNIHKVTAAQVGAVANKGITTEGTGAAYTATVPEITELKAGVSFKMIPNVVSTTTAPTLNVNDFGAKNIRRRVSNSTTTTSAGASEDWLAAGKPITVEYDGTFWIADLPRPNASDLMGATSITNGGTGGTTAAAARTNLGITPENIGASPTNHVHEGQNISPAAIELIPATSAGHGGYIDFHYKGSTDDYTTRLIETNGYLKLNDSKVLTAANVIAVYNQGLDFTDGIATYSNSSIKSNSVCFIQWRAGAVSTLTDSVFGTTSYDGYVTIVAKSGKTGTSLPVNIFILNL